MADLTYDIVMHLSTVEEMAAALRKEIGSGTEITKVSKVSYENLSDLRSKMDSLQDSAAALYDFITEEEIAARGREM